MTRYPAVAMAVASNCPHVLVRIQKGLERESYAVTYREAQLLIEAEIPEEFYPRMRASCLPALEGAWADGLQTHQAEMRGMSS